jgi:DegV family protein with EDD domain
MTTALVTDSISQLPAALADRFGVRVVPITVTLDDTAYRDGVDLTSAEFYERLAAGATVTTAAPPPGEVLSVYEEAATAGAAEILSIHTGADYSGTINSVQVAAGMSPLPVHVVDSGQVSFPTAACVWAAGDLLAAGGSLEEAALVAERAADEVGNVFVIGALELARAGGRLDVDDDVVARATVLALEPGGLKTVAQVVDTAAAIEAMVRYVADVAGSRAIRAGVGDAVAPDLGAALADGIAALPVTAELVRYEVGPSVGAHTGAGTVGAVFVPV